jgi:hypothetical protein
MSRCTPSPTRPCLEGADEARRAGTAGPHTRWSGHARAASDAARRPRAGDVGVDPDLSRGVRRVPPLDHALHVVLRHDHRDTSWLPAVRLGPDRSRSTPGRRAATSATSRPSEAWPPPPRLRRRSTSSSLSSLATTPASSRRRAVAPRSARARVGSCPPHLCASRTRAKGYPQPRWSTEPDPSSRPARRRRHRVRRLDRDSARPRARAGGRGG